MKKVEKYSQYSKKTQDFMAAVERHLKKSFDKIEPQWVGLLDMLATNYELFFECKQTIQKEGLTYTTERGKYEKHPLLKVQTDAQIQIVKLVSEFGISPKGIKKLDVSNAEQEQEFLNNLIG